MRLIARNLEQEKHTSYMSYCVDLRRNLYKIRRDLLQNIGQRDDEHKQAHCACLYICFFIRIDLSYGWSCQGEYRVVQKLIILKAVCRYLKPFFIHKGFNIFRQFDQYWSKPISLHFSLARVFLISGKYVKVYFLFLQIV